METLHTYEVNVLWHVGKKGTLSSPALPTEIEVATPPEFAGGIKEIWTPEHLFIASINACLMSTFFAIAENSNVKYISYESNAIGTANKVDGKFAFTEIVVKPKLVIPTGQDEAKVKRVLEMSEKACTISNSIKVKIRLEPVITIVPPYTN
jgi:organic hydroperoxide reductase OsmC/OhrA